MDTLREIQQQGIEVVHEIQQRGLEVGNDMNIQINVT